MSTGAAPVVPIREDDNPYKTVNQYRKARVIATALLVEGETDPDVVAALETHPGLTKLLAKAAGANAITAPGPVTWALVVELIKEAQQK